MYRSSFRGDKSLAYGQTVENARRDGVAVIEQDAGSQHAGAIRRAGEGKSLPVLISLRPQRKYGLLRFEVLIGSNETAALSQ